MSIFHERWQRKMTKKDDKERWQRKMTKKDDKERWQSSKKWQRKMTKKDEALYWLTYNHILILGREIDLLPTKGYPN